MKVTVTRGDIGTVKSDALIAPINSTGMWLGGIDRVIRNNAGNRFHSQVKPPISDGDTVFARGNGFIAFRNVCFVIDDLQSPTEKIVTNALTKCDKWKCETVTLPAIRLGVMSGAVETREKTIEAICKAALSFSGKNIKHIKIVLWDIEPSAFAKYGVGVENEN